MGRIRDSEKLIPDPQVNKAPDPDPQHCLDMRRSGSTVVRGQESFLVPVQSERVRVVSKCVFTFLRFI
jgi:hypothetical protein